MPTYIAAVTGSAVGASKWHLGLINSAGPRFAVRVAAVRVVPNNTVAVTGLAPSFALKRMTGIGTGTAVTFRKLDKSDRDVPANVTALSNLATPTADSAPELAAVTVSTEETQPSVSAPSLWPIDGLNEPVTLNNGEGLAVQQSALASAGAVDVYIYFRVERKTDGGN